jgi:hypothetical protein
LKYGAHVAHTNPAVITQPDCSLEAQPGDVAYETAQLQGKLEEDGFCFSVHESGRQNVAQLIALEKWWRGPSYTERGIRELLSPNTLILGTIEVCRAKTGRTCISND